MPSKEEEKEIKEKVEQAMHEMQSTVPFEIPQKTEPQITLINMETYEDAIKKFREKITEAVEKGIMSQQAAARIIQDQEHGFFQQLITIEYK